MYSGAGYARRSEKWQHYHANMHTSSTQLAEIANRVKPGKLVLTHLLLWGATEQELVAEIEATYAGEVVCGIDLGIY